MKSRERPSKTFRCTMHPPRTPKTENPRYGTRGRSPCLGRSGDRSPRMDTVVQSSSRTRPSRDTKKPGAHVMCGWHGFMMWAICRFMARKLFRKSRSRWRWTRTLRRLIPIRKHFLIFFTGLFPRLFANLVTLTAQPRLDRIFTASARKRLQPAFLTRQAIGLDAIGHAQLADRLGKIVAHRAMREIQLRGDIVGR